jgi:hypothetical protein
VTTAPAPPAPAPGSPAANAATIAAFLQAHGLNSIDVAGVIGNLQVESGLSPTASNAAEGAIGIAQWEGGRRTALDNYAAATHGSETNLQTQLGYLWQELSGPYSGALSNLKLASTPAAAATVWDTQYEVSAGTTRAARIANANAYASGHPTFSGSAPSSSGGSSSAGGSSGGGTTAAPAWSIDPNPFNWPGEVASTAAKDTMQGLLGAAGAVAKPLVSFLENSLLIVFGLVVVVVGLVLLARAATNDNNNSNSNSSNAAGMFAGSRSARESAEPKAAKAAADAPEVAAA